MMAAIDYMHRGWLVPDSTVWDLVRERNGCLHCRGGFILDGFPRTLTQQHMETEKLSLHAVVNYAPLIDEIISRLSGRRTCKQCKAVFHVTGHPPNGEGVCDHCGGALFQREDDRARTPLRSGWRPTNTTSCI